MREESRNPQADVKLEARIVALVMGEVSASECDELNRLIEERPELAALKAEFESVHALLCEVGTQRTVDHENWKLPAEKRGAILAVIDGQTDVQPPTHLSASTEQRGLSLPSQFWQNLTKIAAVFCVVGFLGLWAAVAWVDSSRQHASNSMRATDAEDAKQRSLTLGGLAFESERLLATPEYAEREDVDYAADSNVSLSAIRDNVSAAGIRVSPDYLDNGLQQFAPDSPIEPMQGEVRLRNWGAANGGREYRANAEQTAPQTTASDAMLAPKVRSDVADTPTEALGMANNSDLYFRMLGREVSGEAESQMAESEPMGEFGFDLSDFGESSESVPEIEALALRTESPSILADELSQLNGSSRGVERYGTVNLPDEQAAEKGFPVDGLVENSNGVVAGRGGRAAGEATALDLLGSRLSTPDQLDERVQQENNAWSENVEQEGATHNRETVAADDGNAVETFWERSGRPPLEQPTETIPRSATRVITGASGSEFVLPTLRGESLSQGVMPSGTSPGLDETSAADEAYSTFSLHVSDVSFKLARAALAKGEWPEVSKIRIEGFVNAFDYGDPLPRRGEEVACLVEQSIHPFLQQRNLLRVSMRTAAAGRASHTPLRLTLLLDNSGSMERIDRQQTLRRAFSLLAQQLKPIDQVTLISFARQPRLLADQVNGGKSQQLLDLIEMLPSEGGTNIEAALRLAFEKAQEQRVDDAQNRIILLTDGAVNLGDADPDNLSHMITMIRAAGIAFDAAGISADGLNDEVLEALTRKGDGRYYLLDSLESADDGFARQIAGALRPSAKNVKVQIEFNPRRVGRYKLLGYEKHLLKQEDFRNDQVDAAEMAAAEAGVALYQFEAKPDGEGDVGSVSVRFRDLTTGRMIENRWPIPYEADVPRADEAAPSLRLAASAALFAARLRGGPLGEAVDLKTLSDLLADLPDRDSSSNHVQQLRLMIEQARDIDQK